MEIIKAPIYVKLTEEERKALRDASDILNELYDIIADNDCEYVGDTCRFRLPVYRRTGGCAAS